MSEIAAAPAFARTAEGSGTKRLMLFFAAVYLAEGICQSDGLISQPLNFYLKQVHGWTAVQITAFLTVFNLPWFFKPLYGIVSDFVPLFGYRRKSWLLLANAAAAVGYFAVLPTGAPDALLVLLLMAIYGMAIVSTLSGAVLVENGQRLGASSRFVNQQWVWFNVAAVATSIMGGVLVQWLTPLDALHAAALMAGITPLVAIACTMMLIDERRSRISLDGVKLGVGSLLAAVKSRRLWVLGGFLFFFYFSPGIDTPLYFFMTDRLKFSQAYIGVLNGVQAAGGIAAGIVYALYLRELTTRNMLYFSIIAGVIGTLTFVLMMDPVTAAIAQFCYGAVSMWTLVASLGLAADCCPERAEGFGFAAMVAITNIAGAAADNVGSYFYEHVFGGEIAPLIVVAAAFTAVNFVLVPMLRLDAGGEARI
ncbi:MAG TPA: MFS transporter [Micropepsaceae bacterium]|nr:MFS transporter [Micropepsaceae bacterium]